MSGTQEYEVERVIDDLLPRAIRPTKVGVRISLDLYLREMEGGPDWAEVVFLDPQTSKQINDPDATIPFDSPEAVSWWVGRLVDKALPILHAQQAEKRGEAEGG